MTISGSNLTECPNTIYQDFDPTWDGIGGPFEGVPGEHPTVDTPKFINRNSNDTAFVNNVPSDSALSGATNTTLDFNAGDRIGLKTTRLVDPTSEQNSRGCRITLLFEYLSDT